jgi:hypothetical protein
LGESLEEGRDDVLEALGWSREEAEAFLDRWKAMRSLEQSADPREQAEYERALRSLGLRPRTVRTDRRIDAAPTGGEAEGRRSRPPSEYREQFEAYNSGVSAP